MKHIGIIIIIFFLTSLFAFWVRAESIFPPQAEVQIVLTPEIPQPNSGVTATARSFSFDSNIATFTWTYNGKRVASGKGVTSYYFNVGPEGTHHRLSVSASALGATFNASVNFRVAHTALVWEAQTYTPPTYRGRALPTSGAFVFVHAFPKLYSSATRTLDPKGLVYQWSLDDKPMPAESGRSKRAFSFRVANGRGVTHKVGVEVTDESKTVRSLAQTTVRVEEPSLLFFEDRTLEGPRYEMARERFLLESGKELRVRAEPFFFLLGSLNALSYQWRADGKLIEGNFSTPRQFSFRADPGSGGEHRLALTIENEAQLFQQTSGSVIIDVK